MLGAGLKNGGLKAHRLRRWDALNRLAARGAEFSAQGRNDWAWFIRAWGEKMCMEHGKAWGRIFAEQTQHLREALETQRKLQDVLALRV